MTKDAFGKDAKPAEYVVGYGKPPKTSRFQKGRSGNPRGRPRMTPSLKADLVIDAYFGDAILREAARPVLMNEGGQTVAISTLEAVIRAQNVAAIKGNQKAQVAAISLVKAAQDRALDGRREFYRASMAYKERCKEEIAECERFGEPRPIFLPDPDDIVIDERTLEVRFNGPRTQEERAEWTTMQARGAGFKAQQVALMADLANNPHRRVEIESQLEQLGILLRATEQAYPDEKVRRQPGFDLLESRRAILTRVPKRQNQK